MTSTSLTITIPFVLIMVCSAVSDLRSRRIPNAFTFAGTCVAIVLGALLGGPSAAVTSVLGAVLGLSVGTVFLALGAMGGGDGKLLMAAGAFLGPARMLDALVVIGVTGAVLALAVVVGRGQLRRSLTSAWCLSLHLTTLGRRGASRYIGAPDALTVPYGVAIAAGALLTWFLFPSGLSVR